jgi:hypothetical protein
MASTPLERSRYGYDLAGRKLSVLEKFFLPVSYDGICQGTNAPTRLALLKKAAPNGAAFKMA